MSTEPGNEIDGLECARLPCSGASKVLQAHLKKKQEEAGEDYSSDNAYEEVSHDKSEEESSNEEESSSEETIGDEDSKMPALINMKLPSNQKKGSRKHSLNDKGHECSIKRARHRHQGHSEARKESAKHHNAGLKPKKQEDCFIEVLQERQIELIKATKELRRDNALIGWLISKIRCLSEETDHDRRQILSSSILEETHKYALALLQRQTLEALQEQVIQKVRAGTQQESILERLVLPDDSKASDRSNLMQIIKSLSIDQLVNLLLSCETVQDEQI